MLLFLLPEGMKDIAVLYEEDAEEWALYLRKLFLPAVDREGILMCPLGACSPQDLQCLGISSYKCKLLIVSDILLQDLTLQRCQFLAGVLVPPESVVTLLCGTNSSDQLYQAMGISQGYWELTTEQEPEDYVRMVESLVLQGRPTLTLCYLLWSLVSFSLYSKGLFCFEPMDSALAMKIQKTGPKR